MMGCGCSFLIGLCAWLVDRPITSPTSSSRKVGFILGTALTAVFSGVFGWRTAKASTDPNKFFLTILLASMMVVSVIVLALLTGTRPVKLSEKAQ